MKDSILKKIHALEEVLKKYEELNKETKHVNLYREHAIISQIEVLEEVLRGDCTADEWIKCYEEDLKERMI